MGRIDFFISYNQADRAWALWIAEQLRSADYTTALQAENFPSGAHFMSELDQIISTARRMILVLSPAYLTSRFVRMEWTAMLARDPTGEKRLLIPVRVRRCRPEGLLATISYIDLVGAKEMGARDTLLVGVRQAEPASGVKPQQRPLVEVSDGRGQETTLTFPGVDQPFERDWLATYEMLKELPESQFDKVLRDVDPDGYCDPRSGASDEAVARADCAVALLDLITHRGGQWWIQLQETILAVRSPFSPFSPSLTGWVGRPQGAWQVDGEQILGLGQTSLALLQRAENPGEPSSLLIWEGLPFRDGCLSARVWLPMLHQDGAAGLVLRHVENQSAVVGLLRHVSPDSAAIELLQLSAARLTTLGIYIIPPSLENDGWYTLSLQLEHRRAVLSVGTYASVTAPLNTDLPAGYVGLVRLHHTLVRFRDLSIESRRRINNLQ